MANKKNAIQNFKPETFTKHNLYGYLKHGRHRCEICAVRDSCELMGPDEQECPVIKEYADKLTSMLQNVPHIQAIDFPLCEELVHLHCRLLLLRMYYASVGEVRVKKLKSSSELSGHPVNKMEIITRNQVIRLSETLGLSPEARRKMAKTSVEIWDVASRAKSMKGAESDVD